MGFLSRCSTSLRRAVLHVEGERARLGHHALEPRQVAERTLGPSRVGAVQGQPDHVVAQMRSRQTAAEEALATLRAQREQLG